ncbi:ubiquinone biosynthesis monooxygenase COQ6, mitochondrial [Copidosoma floridanum]|uniref:ubiquinone biosynthesis monooxygenase COQ6, mitochondrial n=1 Tax=Copidosoma floridanum TaxID=29053 RepID=UPI0006C94A10|nr:ubiquinone biosynthesis monooxygenase COQ6, mitochondrial [Copidosoma floridanum]
MTAPVGSRSLFRGVLSLISKSNGNVPFIGYSQMTRSCHSIVDDEYDIVIAGGGMVGTTLACALANNKRLQDKKILLLERGKHQTFVPKEQYSNRVVALNKHTRILLSSIGVWRHIQAVRFTPVKKMQVWDACSDAMITFNEDYLTDELAYIVENDLLLHAVSTQLAEKKSVKVINDAIIEDVALPISFGSESVIHLKSGEKFKAQLLIGADGQRSIVRQAMGVKYVDWDYDQMAIVATVKLSESTENVVAWQRFLPGGPVALLPLSDSQSSLVWSMKTDEAKRLLEVPEEEFIDNLNDALWKVYPKDGIVEGGMKALQQLLESFQLHAGVCRQLQPSIAGLIEGSRAAFPLGFGHAVHYVQPGVALIGDAAHRVHPLAGQGVNLGFGDISAMVRVLEDAVHNGALIGDLNYLYKYESMRQWHNIPTMLGIDALHRLYKGTAPPIILARSLGLQLTNAIKPFKKYIMQHAADQKNVLGG